VTQHEQAQPASAETPDRKLPPVAEMTVCSMALVVVGGIYMAAQIPGSPSLAPAVVLLVLAAVLTAASAAMLSRVHEFGWQTFRRVFGWALLAYVIIAGMIEYAFVDDGTRGGPLLVLSLMLAIFAVDIPLILSFSVGRYQER
jgi:hypothetical protein